MLLADLPERTTRYMRILTADEKPVPEPVDEEWADLVAVKPAKAKPKSKVVAKPKLKSSLVSEGWDGEFD